MITFFFLIITIFYTSTKEYNVAVTAKNTTKMPLYIQCVTPKKSHENALALSVIQNDLSFLEQFDLSTVTSSKILTKQERSSLLKENYCFAVFIIDKTKNVDVYVHDITTDQTIVGKRIIKNKNARLTAHTISDLIVESLTGQPGFFSTCIAYTKEERTRQNPYIATKQIYIAEYDGSHEQLMVKKPDLVFGIRWHDKITHPLLFYSQHTKTNVQLKTVNHHKKIHIVSNEDGITMLPTFMPNNKGIIVSATGSNGFAQLYHYTLQGVTQLTSYEGNSIAPSFSCNDNMLYFCSDFKNSSPHIFTYNMHTKQVEEITKEGYCTSPVINHAGTALAYTRLIKGIMQIFLYDPHAKTHRQITFDDTNKDSCSWSPCGTYLLYGSTKEKVQQIVHFNIINGKKKHITSSEFRCSSPAWSPVYKDFPLVIS